MNFHKIDITDLSPFQPFDYLRFKLPLVQYLNDALQDSEMMDKAMACAEERFSFWAENRSMCRYLRLIDSYTPYSLAALLGENNPDADFYSRQRKLEFLLSFCLGIYCNDHRDKDITEFIADFGVDNDWSGFALSFKPQPDDLRRLIDSECLSEYFLISKLMERRRVNKNIITEFDGLSLEKKLNLVLSPYYDAEFYLVHEYISLPIHLIRKSEDCKLYTELLNKYSFPMIQKAVITDLKDPTFTIRLFQEVSSTGESEKKTILQRILMEHWFESILTAAINYSITDNGSDKELSDVWESLKGDFFNTKDKLVQSGVTTIKDTIGSQETSKWLFQKQPLTPPKENLNSKVTNEFLSECKKLVMRLVGPEGFDESIHNLAYLSPYIGYYTDNEGPKELYDALLHSLLESIKADRNYLAGNITKELLIKLDIVASFIVKRLGDSAEKLFEEWIRDVGVLHEGIKAVPLSELPEKMNIESNVLLIFLYMVSIPDYKETGSRLFDRISNYCLKQCHYCPEYSYIEQYYLRVFSLCELIADQCLPEKKVDFENSCIRAFPDVALLIMVFANSRTPISGNARQWLENNGKQDWAVLYSRLQSRSQKQYAKSLDESLKRLLS